MSFSPVFTHLRREQDESIRAKRSRNPNNLPQPPTYISRTLNKYKGPPKYSLDTEQSPTSPQKSLLNSVKSAKNDSNPTQVLPLTHIALQNIAKNFEQHPLLEGLEPVYSLAITSVLPLETDVAVTGVYVNDEHYWERMCTQHKKWERCDIAEHGLSWKQLFFERHIAELIEGFGVNREASREFEDSFVRPPIDSTNHRWSELYPGVAKTQPDGRPTRERFCKYGSNCEALRLARSPNSGWPAFERLKPTIISSIEKYRESYAWSSLLVEDRGKERYQPPAPPTPTSATEKNGKKSANPSNRAKPEPASETGDPLAQLMAQLDSANIDEEVPEDDQSAADETECDANALREYLTPLEVEQFKATLEWPLKRKPCIVCTRARELTHLVAHLQAAEDNVFSLRIDQCMSHIDMEIVMARLPNLTSFSLTYGARGIGMQYDRALLGMKISDAMGLAKCFKATQTLTSLVLSCNLLDDDLVRMLLTGLTQNQTVTHLDLSHNKISSYGARLLTKLLGPDGVLMSLNLSDNQIQADGGKYLGRALQHNESLVDLNLRLNRLGDEGSKKLLEGVAQNGFISTLNLSHNEVGSQANNALCRALRSEECVISAIDLSGNDLTETDVESIASCLTGNTTLISLDLRRNQKIPTHAPVLREIADITKKNEISSWQAHKSNANSFSYT